MAHFLVVVSGSKIHERVAHFFIDIYMKHDQQILLTSDGFAFYTSKKYQEQYLHKIRYWDAGRWLSNQLHKALHIQKPDGHQDDIDGISTFFAEHLLMHLAHYDGIYGVSEIMAAIGDFLHTNIADSLQSEDFFVRSLAIVDRRCGKRTLQKLAAEQWVDIPDWLKNIYRIRFEAEGINYSDSYRTH